jgi:hypothetical protein
MKGKRIETANFTNYTNVGREEIEPQIERIGQMGGGIIFNEGQKNGNSELNELREKDGTTECSERHGEKSKDDF